jgi:hypothetical protein
MQLAIVLLSSLQLDESGRYAFLDFETTTGTLSTTDFVNSFSGRALSSFNESFASRHKIDSFSRLSLRDFWAITMHYNSVILANVFLSPFYW